MSEYTTFYKYHHLNMYKLTVLNMTTAAIEQTDGMFRTALILEWVLLSIGFFETMMLWYLLRYTTQYHRNLSCIVEQLPNQYFISIIARIYMIYLQLTIPNAEELIQNEHFLFACWVRNSLLFVAFYFAPFPVIERVFATIFMQDYEVKKRRWISYLLCAILYIHALTSAQFFIFGSNREIHLFMLTGFNLIAFAMTFVMEWYNKRKYRLFRMGLDSKYTLSARTQLSENINSTLPFKMMCFSIAFFAFLCTSLLHVDEYTESQTIRNWFYISFNFSCWSFGTTVPFVMLIYNPQWQKELKRLGYKFCCCLSSQVQPQRLPSKSNPTTRVKDTFGNNCFVNDGQHTSVYFAQLKAEWDGPNAKMTAPRAKSKSKKVKSSSGSKKVEEPSPPVSVNITSPR